MESFRTFFVTVLLSLALDEESFLDDKSIVLLLDEELAVIYTGFRLVSIFRWWISYTVIPGPRWDISSTAVPVFRQETSCAVDPYFRIGILCMVSSKGTHNSVGVGVAALHVYILCIQHCHFCYVYTFYKYFKVTSGAVPCTSDLYSREWIVALITVFGL